MYRLIDDFCNDWQYEREATIRVFKNITDSSLNQKIYEHGRELGRLASHITESIGEMLHKAGLPIDAPTEVEFPKNADEIVATYQQAATAAEAAVRANWTDAALTEEVEMYGQRWNKGTVLGILLTHQTHHRGQLTVLMRQAGLVVPGVYGPSREEWISYGMPALA